MNGSLTSCHQQFEIQRLTDSGYPFVGSLFFFQDYFHIPLTGGRRLKHFLPEDLTRRVSSSPGRI